MGEYVQLAERPSSNLGGCGFNSRLAYLMGNGVIRQHARLWTGRRSRLSRFESWFLSFAAAHGMRPGPRKAGGPVRHRVAARSQPGLHRAGLHALVAKRYTRWPEVPVAARSCGFDSRRAHATDRRPGCPAAGGGNGAPASYALPGMPPHTGLWPRSCKAGGSVRHRMAAPLAGCSVGRGHRTLNAD
jgi:hypothetical protein